MARRRALVIGGAVLLVAVAAPVTAQQDTTSPVVDLAPPEILDIISRITDTGGAVTGLAVQESPTEVEIALAADLLFAFDSAELAPAAREKLVEVADLVRAKAQGPVRIDGYTDSVGDAAYNQALSERRAEAVRNGLAAIAGLEQVQFVVRGHGEADPVAPNQRPDGGDDPEGRQRNRRVTVSFGKQP